MSAHKRLLELYRSASSTTNILVAEYYCNYFPETCNCGAMADCVLSDCFGECTFGCHCRCLHIWGCSGCMDDIVKLHHGRITGLFHVYLWLHQFNAKDIMGGILAGYNLPKFIVVKQQVVGTRWQI